MVVFDTYTLGEMASRIRKEFGHPSSDTTVSESIYDKINEAVRAVVHQRPNWHFLRAYTYVDIQPSVAFTSNVTNGSRTITTTSAVDLFPRDSIRVGTSASYNSASNYIVVSVSGTTVTLDRQFLGLTGSDVAMTRETSYVPMPDDFMRVDIIREVEDLATTREFMAVDPQEFDNLRQKHINGTFTHFHSAVPDPLSTTNTRYICFYPPVDVQTTLRVAYFREVPLLRAESDTLPIPRQDCPAVLYKAMHLYARARSDPRANQYYAEFMSYMQDMLERYSFSGEKTLPDPLKVDRWYPEISSENFVYRNGGPDYT